MRFRCVSPFEHSLSFAYNHTKEVILLGKQAGMCARDAAGHLANPKLCKGTSGRRGTDGATIGAQEKRKANMKISYNFVRAFCALTCFVFATSGMTVSAIGWSRNIARDTKLAQANGTTVVDSNGRVVGKLLNDYVVVRKMYNGYVRLVFDEYGFVPTAALFIYVYATSDCSGTAYLQPRGVPPAGYALLEDSQSSPPYRNSATIYYPGPVSLRTIGSYSRPMQIPPEGCIILDRPSKVLSGTVESQQLWFSPPFSLK